MHSVSHRWSLNSALEPIGNISHPSCPKPGRRNFAGRCHAKQPLTCNMTVAPLLISPASAVAGTSHMPLPVVYGLAAVGLMSVLSLAASGMKFAWRQYMRPANDLSKYGKWAVVTGATGGIGRAYCDYLAEQGIRLPEHSPKDGRSERPASEK